MATSTILDFWKRDEKTIEAGRLDLALRRLRSDADAHIVACETAVLDATDALNKAQMSSLKSPSFKAIAEAQLTLRAAELTLKEARGVYESVFGEAPGRSS